MKNLDFFLYMCYNLAVLEREFDNMRKAYITSIAGTAAIVGVLGSVVGFNIHKNDMIKRTVKDLVSANNFALHNDTVFNQILQSKGIFLSSNGVNVFNNVDVDEALSLIGKINKSDESKEGIVSKLKDKKVTVSKILYDGMVEELRQDLGIKNAIEVFYTEYEDSSKPLLVVYNKGGARSINDQIQLDNKTYKKTVSVAKAIYELDAIKSYSTDNQTVNAYKDAIFETVKYCTLAAEDNKVLKK